MNYFMVITDINQVYDGDCKFCFMAFFTLKEFGR